jgi:hypothetical protein
MSTGLRAALVAALVGVVAGTATALLTVEASDRDPDEPQSTDPLVLGIPLVRYDCTGEGLLVLGHGDASGALRQAMAGHSELDLSYLETAESCDTVFGPERFTTKPAYAVVAGPYPSNLQEPCMLRMTADYRGAFVTALRDGNQISVKCGCVLDSSVAPPLRLGMEADETDALWIRSLQQMFRDANENRFPEEWVTGVYDAHTSDRVRDYQEASNVSTEPGEVDEPTWAMLQSRLCDTYDF